MNLEKDLYFQPALDSAGRLLSQLDRDPFSPTFGNWDRAHWHQRLSDFTSSARQQGVLSLALLHEIQHRDNPFFQHQVLRAWTEASLEYTLRIQHRDGSWDEWYPNERGWAGPTAMFSTRC
jgi:hypothetical protein